MTIKRLAQQFLLLLVMVLAMTAIDWVVHYLRDAWYVENAYFTAKIIFGTVWGVFAVWVIRKVLGTPSTRALAFGVPAMVALFLQTKYFYQGRPFVGFVLPFLFIHFVAFLPASFWIFSRYRSVFIEAGDTVAHPHWGRFIALLIVLEGVFWVYFHLFPPVYY